MGHNYVKEEETFNITRNGTVPKPIAADILAGHVLKADGTWGEAGGGGTVTDVQVDHQSVVDENGVAQIPAIPQVPVQDVEVNGQSVVDQNGVAQIPAIADDLNDLSDVSVSSPTNGQVLKYNSTTQKFENANESGGGGGGNVDDVQVNGTSVVDANKIAKIISYKEVTRAQYNALPDSKYNDGVMYCITDSPNDPYQFPPLIYSTEEREIGVWIDGKPLYQKTFITNQNVPVPDIDIKYSKCTAFNTSNQPIAIPYNDGTTVILYYYDVDNNIPIYAFYSNRITISTYVLTLQYTKTTDTPGSGQWSTQGNHISNEVVQTTGNYDNNMQITLTLTRKYSNPYVYPVNILPLTNWNNGARVVIQTDTIVYDKVNNTISFKVYVSSTEDYKVDWMITELGG